MRFYLSALLALGLANVNAFAPQASCASIQRYVKSLPTIIHMSDGDDWYADYDETKYKQKDSSDSNGNDRGGYGQGNGYERRGGGGGGGHRRGGSVYRRDTSRDNSYVDESAVKNLIQERTEARRAHEYDTADAIREELKNNYDVSIYDKDSTWCTGASASGSGQKYGGGERPGGRRERGGQRDFGPTGHDYEQSADMGPNTSQFTEQEIHGMLAERLQAKMSRNFSVSDSIQMELIEGGVSVHDGMKEWRADGVPYGSLEGGRRGLRSGERNNYGGRGGETVYERDTSRDNSNVDEAAVMDLIQQRTEAREFRDYGAADAIREDLVNNYNVGIDDREGTWRTGVSASGSGQKYGGGGRPGGRRERGGRRDFGPTGHDYEQSADMGPNTSQFTEQEIHGMLAERLQAKMSRNFSVSDSIQMELIEGGVFVHDGMKEWRADGVPYGSLDGGRGPGRTVGSRNDRVRYTKSPHSESVEGVEDSLIDKLVEERVKFKMTRDYDKADEIRAGLKSNYNVFIEDRIRQWSVGGYFDVEKSDNVTSRNYVKSASSLQLSAEDEEFVQQQVDKRLLSKRDHDFQTADDIRAELIERFDVIIHDKLRVWSVGGEFEELMGRGKKANVVYKRRGGGQLSDEDVAAITQMLATRYEAKKERNFDVADAIRDDLMRTFNVMVDDRSNEWHIDTDDYAMVGENSLSPEDIEYIDSKMKERFLFKRERSYDEADAIRENLTEIFGVSICDRTKEWSIVIAEHNFVEEEQLEYTPKNNDEQSEEDKKLDDTLEAIFNGSSNDDIEVDNDFEASAEEDKIEDNGDAKEDELLSIEALSKLTVPLLKEKLKIAGLPVSGRKAELISRLLEETKN